MSTAGERSQRESGKARGYDPQRGSLRDRNMLPLAVRAELKSLEHWR
jgi:hypothetical protein